ncbi:MAG: PrsW family intramembrane metalloprotease [Ardenticatenaceae bacterium]|nr:PrsW family intramembrane metalloprotease [Anaerolineales bacterium]MCB9008185.1 PrsW family intramembrane metalloprotease [Ardenticatenaceae bacterium]
MNGPWRQRSGLWQADIASIVLLVLFVLVIFGLEAWLQPQFTPTSLVITGILMALVPAVVWLAFFYRRDRLEPEPKHLILQMVILGGLLASALGIPLVEGVFDVPAWLSSSPAWAQLLGGFLIVGMVQEYLKYAAVRYSVYYAADFDEAIDGIIYTTAVAVGFAVVLNIHFVVSSGGVDLGSGAIRMVLTTLAQASFAGVVGYFLGRMKFEKRPLWWMPLGLVIAAALNSLFYFLRGNLSQGSLSTANSWVGLLLAAVLAGIVTWFLSRSIQHDLAVHGGD